MDLSNELFKDDELPDLWQELDVREPEDLPNPPPIAMEDLQKFVLRQQLSDVAKRKIAHNLVHYKSWRVALGDVMKEQSAKR